MRVYNKDKTFSGGRPITALLPFTNYLEKEKNIRSSKTGLSVLLKTRPTNECFHLVLKKKGTS